MPSLFTLYRLHIDNILLQIIEDEKYDKKKLFTFTHKIDGRYIEF